MKVSPAHDEKQTLIRGRREMSQCLLASQGQKATGVQHLRLDPMLVEHTDEVKIVWEGLASSYLPKGCTLVSAMMKMPLLLKAVFIRHLNHSYFIKDEQ